MNDDGFLIRIASEEGEIVLTATKIFNGEVRVVRHRVATGAPAGERRLAVVAEGRDAGRPVLLPALFGLGVRVQLLLGGPDAAPGRPVNPVERGHGPPAVHHEVLAAAAPHLLGTFQIPASRGRNQSRSATHRRHCTHPTKNELNHQPHTRSHPKFQFQSTAWIDAPRGFNQLAETGSGLHNQTS